MSFLCHFLFIDFQNLRWLKQHFQNKKDQKIKQLVEEKKKNQQFIVYELKLENENPTFKQSFKNTINFDLSKT